MEIDKLKQWLDLAQQYQAQGFWNQIFTDKTAEKNEMGQMVNPFSLPQEYAPKCDLFETDGFLIAEIEIPGLKRHDIQVAVNEQTVVITGELKALQANGKYYLKERVNRKFKKELTLPFPILPDQCTNEVADGVLVISMPVKAEDMEAIPISFESSSD
ncbi:Hsp20/alpha crystallin family protein [Neobacillus sp. SM06]|uniref:Hsp20/alpha crystallin family protein n=1 Tax=Neobacillus sp. SM06 TaxID=3422492 RepID=UPI003D2B368B